MKKFLVALRKECLELWRTYRLLVVGIVLVVFGLLSPLMAKYTPEIIKMIPEGETIALLIPAPTMTDAVAQYVKNIAQFGLILGLLLTMGVVAQEKDKGTAAMMLVKPLPRVSFLAAKFSALAMLFALAITLAALACYYYTFLLFGALDVPRWLALNALLLVYVLVYIAATLFFSVATRSAAAAGGLAFGLMLILEVLGALPGIGKYMPAQMLGWGIGLLNGSAAAYWPALGICFAIIVIFLAGAWRIFERQEL